MQKSPTLLILTLVFAGLFGAVLVTPFGIYGILLSLAAAAYMYHFRTLAQDWTDRELFFNLALALVALLGLFFGNHCAILKSIFDAYAVGFISIYVTALGRLLLRNRRG